MAEKLIDLRDRIVLDDGRVAMSYPVLMELARDGVDLEGLTALDDDRTCLYNRITGGRLRLVSHEPDGIFGPSDDSFRWTTPEPYSSMDVYAFLWRELEDRGLIGSPIYRARLKSEIVLMDERDMVPVLRHIKFLVDDFERRGVVWGVGRGSSCASLSMHLIGLNLIDPVKYDIPMTEFFR